MPRRPSLRFGSSRVRCPDPTCRQPQRALTEHGRFRGRGIRTCSCGQAYFYNTSDGVTEVVGLWPGEDDAIDVDAPLAAILDMLGMMEAVA